VSPYILTKEGFFMFQGGCRGGGWGPGWNNLGWGGGWGFGGPCNKCGHCCYCNRNHNMTMLGLAAMHYACLCRGPFREIPPFKHGGFPVFGGGLREDVKERICEDVRTGRGAYRYF